MITTTLHYVTRDGAKRSPYFLTDTDAFGWLLAHQGNSVHHATTHEGYAFATLTGEPWSPDEANDLRNTRVWEHDHGPVTGDRDERNLVRANCGACVLGGYRDRDDDESPTDEPNYAGWARIYVQNRRAVPAKWLTGLTRALNEDSPYGEALRRDVLTFGLYTVDAR